MTTKTETKAWQIRLAAEKSFCYPGELITFHIELFAPETKGVQLQISWPDVVSIDSYTLPEGVPVLLPAVSEQEQSILMMIPLEEYFNPGQSYEIVVNARMNTYYINQYLHTDAQLVNVKAGEILARETVRSAIFGQGRYLKYLPEIYQSDDFMSRYLMLFESFWKPVDVQINQMEHYFDPKLTPERMIPWLASWVGLPMDDFLPIERTRELMNQALMIYQLRGTVRALKVYLEIYTGGLVELTEHRSSNFVLGEQNRLGLQRSLGTSNKSGSLTVDLQIGKEELERSGLPNAMYVQKIEDLIRNMIPAHVRFEVNCNFTKEKTLSRSLE